MGCHYVDVNNNRCDHKYELRYLLFRDPISRETNEISICPRHFTELVDEPLIRPVKKLSMKRDNLIAKQNRERAIAKRNDVILLPTYRVQIDDIREQIRRQLAYKCSNILCGTSISTLNPVYSMMIVKINYNFVAIFTKEIHSIVFMNNRYLSMIDCATPHTSHFEK